MSTVTTTQDGIVVSLLTLNLIGTPEIKYKAIPVFPLDSRFIPCLIGYKPDRYLFNTKFAQTYTELL